MEILSKLWGAWVRLFDRVENRRAHLPDRIDDAMCRIAALERADRDRVKAIVDAVGGHVDGAPTNERTYLTRLRLLVFAERELTKVRHELLITRVRLAELENSLRPPMSGLKVIETMDAQAQQITREMGVPVELLAECKRAQ